MTASVIAPFPLFADRAGVALATGFIYIGSENLNPMTAANRIAVFSDRALTVPLAQPVNIVGGYAVTAAGAPCNVYAATAFAMTVTDRNNVPQLTSPSYGFAVLSAAITFGAVVVSVSLLPDAAGGAFIGSVALPFSLGVFQDVKAKTATVYDTTQPAAAADLAKISQLSVDLLVCSQTNTADTAAVAVNFKNTSTITRDSTGVWTVTPIIALPATYVVELHARAFSAGTTPLELVCTTRGTASLVISSRINNVAAAMAWDLVIKGNPAVADPIS